MAKKLNARQMDLAQRFLGSMHRGDSKGMWDVLEEAHANDSARAAEADRAQKARVEAFMAQPTPGLRFLLAVPGKRGGLVYIKGVSYAKSDGWKVAKWVFTATRETAYQWGPASGIEVGKQLAAQYLGARMEAL
jgi:hypothetical protein